MAKTDKTEEPKKLSVKKQNVETKDKGEGKTRARKIPRTVPRVRYWGKKGEKPPKTSVEDGSKKPNKPVKPKKLIRKLKK